MSENQKNKQARSKLDQLCQEREFLNFGSPLEGYGKRYVKFSDKKREHGMSGVEKYIGEWSYSDNKPYGRGVVIYKSGRVDICYFDGCDKDAGSYIAIETSGKFRIGEVYYNRNGRKKCKGTEYYTNGDESEYERFID